MQTKLLEIANLFATLSGIDVYHYVAPNVEQAPYVVWSEDDRIDGLAGNVHAEKAWQGTVDLFTHTEFDLNFNSIETLLDGSFQWYFESASYEEDTKLIHYQWVWTYA